VATFKIEMRRLEPFSLAYASIDWCVFEAFFQIMCALEKLLHCSTHSSFALCMVFIWFD